MPRKTQSDLASKVRRAIKAHKLGKKHYELADALKKEIAREVEPGEKIPLNEKEYAVLKDNFADKDIVWNPCAARRWDIEVKPA